MAIDFSNQHLNRMRESNVAPSISLTISSREAMNGFINAAYGRNFLANVDEFYGLVVYQMVRNNPSADCFGSQVVQEGQESKSLNDYQSYRVYVPELECRPFPETYTDPVISTYREMCASTGILTTVGVGSIVIVKFLNFATLGRPLIVGVEGAIEGGMVPVRSTNLSTSHSGGLKKNLPFKAGQRAMYVGDSMSALPISFGGWIGRFLHEAGFEVKPATERPKGGRFWWISPSCWSYFLPWRGCRELHRPGQRRREQLARQAGQVAPPAAYSGPRGQFLVDGHSTGRIQC